MEWTDDGIVLSARKHGESAAIVSLLTREHGRHPGLVRGGSGPRARGLYQAGNRVVAKWRGRLPEHLGAYSCELSRSTAAAFLEERLPLAVIGAACGLVEVALPERHPYGRLYEGLAALLEGLGDGVERLVTAYVRWELLLLAELGYGLDLSVCAATGANDGLAYVSPKTGRAVSLSAGEPYRERLLPLPGFLLGAAGEGEAIAGPAEALAGLRLTGFFIERYALADGRIMPAIRRRLEGLVSAAAEATRY